MTKGRARRGDRERGTSSQACTTQSMYAIIRARQFARTQRRWTSPREKEGQGGGRDGEREGDGGGAGRLCGRCVMLYTSARLPVHIRRCAGSTAIPPTRSDVRTSTVGWIGKRRKRRGGREAGVGREGLHKTKEGYDMLHVRRRFRLTDSHGIHTEGSAHHYTSNSRASHPSNKHTPCIGRKSTRKQGRAPGSKVTPGFWSSPEEEGERRRR